MNPDVKKILKRELVSIQKSGLYKDERVIFSPQGASIGVNVTYGGDQS